MEIVYHQLRYLTPEDRSVGAEKTLLWVDPNITNAGNTRIQDAARQCNIRVHAFKTMGEAEGFLRSNPLCLTAPGSRFRIMSNMVEMGTGGRANDYYAGQSRSELLRHTFAIHAPILIFCGSPEKADPNRAINTGTILTKDEDLAKCFACFLPYHGFGYCAATMFPAPTAPKSGFDVVGLNKWSFSRPTASTMAQTSPFHDGQSSILFRMLEDMLRVNIAHKATSSFDDPLGYCGLSLEKVHYVFPSERGTAIQDEFRRTLDRVNRDKDHVMKSEHLTLHPNLMAARAATAMIEYPAASPTLMFHVVEDDDKFLQRGYTEPRAEGDARWHYGFSTAPKFFKRLTSCTRIYVSWVILGYVEPETLSRLPPTSDIRGRYFVAEDGSDCFIPKEESHVCPVFCLEVSVKSPLFRA